MANTVTQRTLAGDSTSREVVRLINIVSDGSEESDLVIYDNSAFINDVTKGKLLHCQVMGSDSLVFLEWDQSTDSPILSANPVNSPKFNFRHFGGIPNPGGTGATGDLLLSTANLDSGDQITLLITIRQN